MSYSPRVSINRNDSDLFQTLVYENPSGDMAPLSTSILIRDNFLCSWYWVRISFSSNC